MADTLAQKIPVAYPEGAFIAGLLHDMGQLLIAIGLPDQYLQIMDRAHTEGCSTAEAERDVLGFTHSELSAEALLAWNLPAPIQEAVRDHHIGTVAPKGGVLLLASVVNASDRYVNSTGASILSPSRRCGSRSIRPSRARAERRGPKLPARRLRDRVREHEAVFPLSGRVPRTSCLSPSP